MASPPISLSIVVPARNEAGHISLSMSPLTAVPSFDMRCFKQPGLAAVDAVRRGFGAGSGGVVAFHRADLSVPPESIRSFFRHLQTMHRSLVET